MNRRAPQELQFSCLVGSQGGKPTSKVRTHPSGEAPMICCCPSCSPQPPTAPEPERPPATDDGSPGPAPAPFCAAYTVTFTTLEVSRSDDGFASGELEVEISYTVNGQTERDNYFNSALQVQTYQLSHVFTVPILTRQSVISVHVRAVEQDTNTYNPHIATYGESANWGGRIAQRYSRGCSRAILHNC